MVDAHGGGTATVTGEPAGIATGAPGRLASQASSSVRPVQHPGEPGRERVPSTPAHSSLEPKLRGHRGDPTHLPAAEAARGRAGQESEGLYRVLSTRGCCAHAVKRARASLGVGWSFRASAARYRLGWPSPIRLQPLHEHEVRAGSWRLPATALNGPTIVNPARPSLLDFPSPSESITSEPPCEVPVRRPSQRKGSPHELLGPFSTSSREDSPARGSRPAVVRLRRWFGLDGFPPSRPCQLVSSGGTHGVPGFLAPEHTPKGRP